MVTVQNFVASIPGRRFQLMNAFVSDYAQYDHAACKILLGRLEAAARQKRLVTYDEFVRGVSFVVPDRNQSMPMVARTVDTTVLKTEDEAMIHDFGRYLAAATYRDSAVFLNALLVRSKTNPYPSAHFFDWLRRIGMLYATDRSAEQDYWLKSVATIHKVYGESLTIN